jgi:uncharacterized protein YraI
MKEETMKASNIHSRIWLLVPVLLLVLPACGPSPSNCTADDLQAPVNLDPHEETVPSADNVNLSWNYQPPTCSPDFFEATVWSGLEPANPATTQRLIFDFPDPSGDYNMAWSSPLQPGKTYFFRVSAGLETGTGQDATGPGAISWFYTGPICTDDAAMQPINLINPNDEATVDPSGEISFVWDDPTACLVNGLFEIQVSTHQDFSDYLHRIPILQTVYTTDASEFGIENCTRYYWRVMTDPNGTQEGPYSPVWSFYAHDPNTKCTSPSPEAAIAIAKQDLNCRSGPSPLYEIKDAFLQGGSAPIQGRNEEGGWWYILSPHLQILCWVWGEQVEVQGDTGQVEVQGDTGQVEVVHVAPPVLQPTASNAPQAVNCGQYKDQASCDANPACTWASTMAGPGICKN